ncbi:MAG TPA: HigA family addiction module antitoxin [Nitrospiria bacterium]|nr:HigA family addiction module antitoxin [Nitrospiria bacterium]
MSAPESNFAAWVRKAEHDLLNIQNNLASSDVPWDTVCFHEIVQKKRGISADTALRLGRYFTMSPEFWMNLQVHYDLESERDKLAHKLEKTVRVYAA